MYAADTYTVYLCYNTLYVKVSDDPIKIQAPKLRD